MQVNKFKSPLINRWLTRGLFADVAMLDGEATQRACDPSTCMYWLNNNLDGDTRPVLRHKFIELRDPTGVQLAKKYLGGWEHLQKLLEHSWFDQAWKNWQEELFKIKQAEALQRIFEIAEEGSSQSLAANKYIAAREWETPQGPKRGRPSKDEVAGELKNAVKEASQSQTDYLRMVVNNSNKANK